MPRHWRHGCMLSHTERENCDHKKGDAWIIQLIKDHLEKTTSQ